VVAHARMLLHALLGLLLAWAKMGLDWVLGVHGEVYGGRLEAGDVGGRWIVGLGLGGHTAGDVLAGLRGKELGWADGLELGRGRPGRLPEHLEALLMGRDGRGLLDGQEAGWVLRSSTKHPHRCIRRLARRETHVGLPERRLGGLRRILDERRCPETKWGHPALAQQVRADVGVHGVGDSTVDAVRDGLDAALSTADTADFETTDDAGRETTLSHRPHVALPLPWSASSLSTNVNCSSTSTFSTGSTMPAPAKSRPSAATTSRTGTTTTSTTSSAAHSGHMHTASPCSLPKIPSAHACRASCFQSSTTWASSPLLQSSAILKTS
jgi:hypothetical protein